MTRIDDLDSPQRIPVSTLQTDALDEGPSHLYPRAMIRSVDVPSPSLSEAAPRPVRLSFFVFCSLLDMFIVVFAVVTILGYVGLPQVFDGQRAGVEVWGSRYSLNPPTYPWIAGALGALSVGAAWFARDGRRFAFVLAVALAWVALGLAAIATGSGAGLLAQRTVWALLLFTSRSWFRN